MSDNPTVTVCIPTFNRRDLLARSLQSVLDQSWQDLEVIVSDNASTDGTQEYIRGLTDPRVRYDRLDQNIGLFGNLTRCLHLGTGRYRVMLPDDDLMLAGNLAAKVRFMQENPSAGMVHSGFRQLAAGAQPIGPVTSWARLDCDTLESGESFLRRSLRLGGIVCVPSVMLRSDLVAAEQFDPDDGPYADIALWLRVATRSDIGFLPAPLSGYLVHAASASSGFALVKVRRGHHRMTRHHADAILQAHGRFVDRAELDPGFRAELRALLIDADRRMRWTIRAHHLFSTRTLSRLKTMVGWRTEGNPLYRRLALDGALGTAAPVGPLEVNLGDRNEGSR